MATLNLACLRGAVILGSLFAVWTILQLRQYNLHIILDGRKAFTLTIRQLVVPDIAPSLPHIDTFHTINRHGDSVAPHNTYALGGKSEEDGYPSLDKHGNNLADGSGQREKGTSTSASKISPRGKPQVPKNDFEAKKNMFESNSAGAKNAGDSGTFTQGKPARGTVSNLKGQFEGGISKPSVPEPNPARMRPGSDAYAQPGNAELPKPGLPAEETVSNLKGQFEGGNSDLSVPKPDPARMRPGSDAQPLPGNAELPKPGLPAEGTVSNLKGQFEGSSTSSSKPSIPEPNPGTDAHTRPGNAELPKPGTVSGLRNKFENPTVGDSSSGAPTDPVLQDVSIADQLREFSAVDANGNPVNPIGQPQGEPGRVSDLRNKFENPAVGESTSGAPSDPVLQDVSIADQLKEFSSVDVNGNPVDPAGSPQSGSPAPKQGHHDKINSWERLKGKEAKNRPEATYDLVDPALNPRPPFEPIPQDAGLDIDSAVKNGMEAVRKQNPEIKKMDKEINDLVKNMQKNAAAVKDGDAQIAKIKETQARRDAEEKEMMQQKSNLDGKRKRLADERAKLAKQNSRRQEERTLEAKDELLRAYQDFAKSLENMASTVSDMKAWTKTTESMLEQYASDVADWKALEQAINTERAKRREASKAKKAKGKGKAPPEVPPIVQSAKIENGQIVSIKTNVPPADIVLPDPLAGGMITADNPMRMALDDIRIKGKLTQETADKLVSSAWGISPEAEQYLRDNNIPYDNMALAKSAIATFAATVHLLPATAFVSAPEALELAALAGSPEIFAATGISLAAPEIASTAVAALPAINAAAGVPASAAGALTEEGVKQAVVAAQVVSIGGKGTLVTSSKKSLALLAIGAAGAAGLGTGLGLMVAGLFARKRAKDDVKNAVSTVHTTVSKVKSETTVEHITKVVAAMTTKSKDPKPTPTKISKTTSENSIKPSQTKTSRSFTMKSTSLSLSKPTGVSKTTTIPSSPVIAIPRETGKGPIILPPVIVPLPPHSTNTTNSTTISDNGTQPIVVPPVVGPVLPPQITTNGTNSTITLDNSTVPVVLPPLLEPASPPHTIVNGTNSTTTVDISTSPMVLPHGPKVNDTESIEPGDNSSRPVVLPPVIMPIVPPHVLTNTTDSAPIVDSSTHVSDPRPGLTLNVTQPDVSYPTLELDSTRPVLLPASPTFDTTKSSGQATNGIHPIIQPLCTPGNSTELTAICRNVTGEVTLASLRISAMKTLALTQTRGTKSIQTKSPKPSRKATYGNIPAIPGLITTTGSWNRTKSATTSKLGQHPTGVAILTTFETLVKPTASGTPT
ncbi:hypothetical protein VTL71DRAFT_6590 [Oculimacula yallundae]|uniref:Uncharacterized protein n=1 Tax=Oculimacula yallundae TaxID=86028 RepID=A0ABR4BXC5_9HELO